MHVSLTLNVLLMAIRCLTLAGTYYRQDYILIRRLPVQWMQSLILAHQ